MLHLYLPDLVELLIPKNLNMQVTNVVLQLNEFGINDSITAQETLLYIENIPLHRNSVNY